MLIQSGTCEEYGLSMPKSKKDCQARGRPVGINDNNVSGHSSRNKVCGCRTLWHRGALHLHWNAPNSACSKHNHKCNNNGKCVCVSKGRKVLFLTFCIIILLLRN